MGYGNMETKTKGKGKQVTEKKASGRNGRSRREQAGKKQM
jgi:hypothetical protein